MRLEEILDPMHRDSDGNKTGVGKIIQDRVQYLLDLGYKVTPNIQDDLFKLEYKEIPLKYSFATSKEFRERISPEGELAAEISGIALDKLNQHHEKKKGRKLRGFGPLAFLLNGKSYWTSYMDGRKISGDDEFSGANALGDALEDFFPIGGGVVRNALVGKIIDNKIKYRVENDVDKLFGVKYANKRKRTAEKKYNNVSDRSENIRFKPEFAI